MPNACLLPQFVKGKGFQYDLVDTEKGVLTVATTRPSVAQDYEVCFGNTTNFNASREVEILLVTLSQYKIFIPNTVAIREFMHKHPDQVHILPEVCRASRTEFPLPAQLCLEVRSDPEIDDEELVLYIRQKQYDDDILKKIENIWEVYENVLTDNTGWLLVTTDFLPPLE